MVISIQYDIMYARTYSTGTYLHTQIVISSRSGNESRSGSLELVVIFIILVYPREAAVPVRSV
jgi:hypothetical protein